MITNLRQFVPGWLLVAGLLSMGLNLLTGTLVFAARQQPDDRQTCLKISPENGPFSYVFFDADSGTRLNMPQDVTTAVSYQQTSSIIDFPDHTRQVVVMESTTAPISYLAVTNTINGKRHIRNLGSGSTSFEGWSEDGKYVAVSLRTVASEPTIFMILSGHDLSERLRFIGFASFGAWSTHGHRFAFINQKESRAWLTILNMDQSQEAFSAAEILLPDEYHYILAFVQWSADDQYLLLTTNTTADLVSADGGPVQQVIQQRIPFGSDYERRQLIWLPDDLALLYVEFPKHINALGTLNAYYPHERRKKVLAREVIYLTKYLPDTQAVVLARADSLYDELTYSLLLLSTGRELVLSASEVSEYLPRWDMPRPSTNLKLQPTNDKYSWDLFIDRKGRTILWTLHNVGDLANNFKNTRWFTCANLS